MLQKQSCIKLTQLKRCVIAIKSLHGSYCWTEFQDGCSSKCLKTVLSDMISINLLISKKDFTKLVSVIIGKDDQQLSLRILQKQNRLQSIYVPTKPTHKSCNSNLPFDPYNQMLLESYYQHQTIHYKYSADYEVLLQCHTYVEFARKMTVAFFLIHFLSSFCIHVEAIVTTTVLLCSAPITSKPFKFSFLVQKSNESPYTVVLFTMQSCITKLGM